jgi:hypothetical protein
MTMHTEQSAIRSAGYPFADLFAPIRAKYMTWRAQRIERAQSEALAGLDSQILDDIGVSIVNDDRHLLPVFSPYGIVAAEVFAPRKRDESSEF